MDHLAPDPRLVELRLELEHARSQGVGFQDAWAPAVRQALDGATQWEREVYGSALSATRTAWADAYDGVPASAPLCRELDELESFAVDGELDSMRPELAA